jgi:adenylate cyclase
MGSASKESSTKARVLLKRALEIDPSYAWAWSRLALTHYWDARFGFSASREESWKRGVELAKKAIALDEQFPEGYVTLALLYLFRKQYEEAVAEGEKAVALGPNDSTTLTRVAQVMHYSGKFEEALSMLKRAKRMNPHYELVLLRFLGGAYRFTGQTEKAIEAFKEVLERMLKRKFGRGSAFIPLIHLASIYGEIGLLKEAQGYLKEALELNPDISMQWARKYLIFRNPADSERVMDGLRKAGLK